MVMRNGRVIARTRRTPPTTIDPCAGTTDDDATAHRTRPFADACRRTCTMYAVTRRILCFPPGALRSSNARANYNMFFFFSFRVYFRLLHAFACVTLRRLRVLIYFPSKTFVFRSYHDRPVLLRR